MSTSKRKILSSDSLSLPMRTFTTLCFDTPYPDGEPNTVIVDGKHYRFSPAYYETRDPSKWFVAIDGVHDFTGKIAEFIES